MSRDPGYRLIAFLLICVSILVPGCATLEQTKPTAFGFIALGDAGYHYDYVEDYVELARLTPTREAGEALFRAMMADMHLAEEDLAPPAAYFHPQLQGYVLANGQGLTIGGIEQYCASSRCDFGLMLGDNIYPRGATLGDDGVADSQRFKDILQDPFAPLIDLSPTFKLYSVLGNHDWATSRAGAMAEVAFLEKTPPFFMDGIDYQAVPAGLGGEVEIFAIDTDVLLAGVDVYEARLAEDGSEASPGARMQPMPWMVAEARQNTILTDLEAALKRSTARWKFVIGHHPLWSSSGTKFEEARALRQLILPTLCQYADAYIAGHDHTLEIHQDDCSKTGTAPIGARPLTQIVSGAASRQRNFHSRFMRHQAENYPQLTSIFGMGNIWGFAHVAVEGDTATVTLLTVDDASATDFSAGHGIPRLSEVFRWSFPKRFR